MDVAPIKALAESLDQRTWATLCAMLAAALLLAVRAWEKRGDAHIAAVSTIREGHATEVAKLHADYSEQLNAARDAHLETATQLIPVTQDMLRLQAELQAKVTRRRSRATPPTSAEGAA